MEPEQTRFIKCKLSDDPKDWNQADDILKFEEYLNTTISNLKIKPNQQIMNRSDGK